MEKCEMCGRRIDDLFNVDGFQLCRECKNEVEDGDTFPYEITIAKESP